ncbi:hypothetical protein HPULCUR_006279 [Helicostylum pulchrum]|uniref:Uncharacterized protein n=1 Tax=Helicostylum pulchrum TaxID=562976 RepID=A0ABP9Y2Q9_9FUNG
MSKALIHILFYSGKRKNTEPGPGPSTRRRKNNDPPVEPPQDPNLLELPNEIVYFTRKCKASTLLNPLCNGYRVSI